MAERVITVCDVCGAPATESVMFKVGGRSLQKDLCQTHLAELTAGAHAPKRGRRRGSVNATPTPVPSRAKRTRKPSIAKATSKVRRRRPTPKTAAEG